MRNTLLATAFVCLSALAVSLPDQRLHELVRAGFVKVLRDLERLDKVEAPVE